MNAEFDFLVVALAWVVVLTLPVLALAAVVYRFATLPFRSLEQVRFLLDVIETGLKDGKRPEQAIVEVARQRECNSGNLFRELAARLEQGLTLGAALDKTPRLLPPQVTAMLKVGMEINDLPKILPAVRKVLHDDLAECRNSQYFDIATTVATSLALILVVQVLGTWVYPNVHATMTALDADKHVLRPILFDTLAAHRNLWAGMQIVFMFAVAAWGLVYLGGTERVVWLQMRFPRQAARLWEKLPWRYKRLQRDFSFLLAVLLDAHVPEEKAVAMAAAGTASPEFTRRASAVIQDLRDGLWLPSAIEHIDDEIEVHWRLLKAVHKQDGFLRALAGWHDWLESRALQQEQIVLNVTQLAAFVCNGVMVGLVAVSVFQILITVFKLTAP